MNKLTGTIQDIEIDGDISIINILIGNTSFSAITIDEALPMSLNLGDDVTMGFKETAMSIGKGISGGLSIRNRFKAVIKSLTTGKLLTKLVLDFQGHDLISVITTASAKRMNLQIGDQVEGLVKTTDMVFIKNSH